MTQEELTALINHAAASIPVSPERKAEAKAALLEYVKETFPDQARATPIATPMPRSETGS